MPQNHRKNGRTEFVQEDDVIQDISRQRTIKTPYRKIAAQYGSLINYGDIQRIHTRGEFPKSNDKRAALGLAPLAPAPVCHRCGDVHVAKRCTQNSGKRELITLPPVGERPALLAEIYERMMR